MTASVPASVALDQAQEIALLKAALDLASGEVERLRAGLQRLCAGDHLRDHVFCDCFRALLTRTP